MGDRKIKVSASVMCIDWLQAGRQLEILQEGDIDYLHWDIMDGRFVPDFTMGSAIINPLRKASTLRSEYHLMVEEPSRIFDSLEITPGETITIHQECCRNLHRDLVALRRKGARVGVALCPATPLDVLNYIIEDIDYVLVMTVNPGFSGQPLVPQMLRKIADLRKLVMDMQMDIQIAVDGNVSFENIPPMIEAGADVLVVGSSGLFRDDMSLQDALKLLRSAIDEGLRSA